MKQQPGRLFVVTSADFPLSVEIESVNLRANQAYVGDCRISVNGRPVTEQHVNFTANGNILTYSISKPAQKKFELLSVVTGFFDDDSTDNSRYVVRIKAASGDNGQTKLFPPAVNPAAAFLVFRLG